MKSWRTSIEALGFRRWRYEKLPHFHGIVFRAVDDCDAVSTPRLGMITCIAVMIIVSFMMFVIAFLTE